MFLEEWLEFAMFCVQRSADHNSWLWRKPTFSLLYYFVEFKNVYLSKLSPKMSSTKRVCAILADLCLARSTVTSLKLTMDEGSGQEV